MLFQGAQEFDGYGPLHVHQYSPGQGAEPAGRPGGAGPHVHVFPPRQPALAGPQGGHAQGAIPEDWRHQARHAHRGIIYFLKNI